MKSKIFTAVVSLVMVVGLALGVVAQNAKPAKSADAQVIAAQRPTTVNIKCTPYMGNSDVETKVFLENNTGALIAAGRTLYWKTNANISGQFKLVSALPVGGKLSDKTLTPSNSTACSSYFLK